MTFFDPIFDKIHEQKLQAAQEFGVNEPFWSWLEDMYCIGLHPEGKTPEYGELYSKIIECYYELEIRDLLDANYIW